MSKSTIGLSKQIYAFLLKFYPANHRKEFGAEMQYVFSESLKDAYQQNGEQGILNLWARTIVDTGKSLLIQNFENLRGGVTMTSKNTILAMRQSALRITLVTFAILAIPFIGTQVSSEWDWKFFDFLIIGMLISVTGFFIELVRCKVKNKMHRVWLIAGLILAGLLVWAELAVGIFGTPFAGS